MIWEVTASHRQGEPSAGLSGTQICYFWWHSEEERCQSMGEPGNYLSNFPENVPLTKGKTLFPAHYLFCDKPSGPWKGQDGVWVVRGAGCLGLLLPLKTAGVLGAGEFCQLMAVTPKG